MKTQNQIVQEITVASDNNDMMKLVSIHDELLQEDIGTVSNALKRLLKNDTIVYDIFVNASTLSKVDSNGLFKKIIKQSVKREMVV